MTSYVTKKLAKHVLQENAGNHFGSEDPYFEYVAATDMNGATSGKTIKRKRAIPPGLTKQEEKILKKVTRRAHRLDNCIDICGIKIGWSAVVGIIPGAGDLVDALLAFMVVWTCTQAQIPQTLKSRMVLNIALDFAVGLVPFIGDVADAFFRCNTRNASLLYKHLQARGAARITQEEKQQKIPKQIGKPSESSRSQQGSNMLQSRYGEQSDPPATVDTSQEMKGKKQSGKLAQTQLGESATVNGPQRPGNLMTRGNKAPVGSGWLSRFSARRQQEPDLENGESH